jgi:L-ascorbate metabolism protein UlaG (beta-lactamase superfamily)
MAIKIKYLGHNSFILSLNKKKILTDPFFAKKNGFKKRLIPCSHKVTEIPKIDTILISHEHGDSFDIKNTNYLVKKYNPKIVAHQSVLNKIDCSNLYKVPIKEYETKKLHNISYYAQPAHHPTSFYPLSYKLSFKNKSIYFAGDTYLTKDHDSLFADVMLLPIGGNRTLDIPSVVKILKRSKPKYLFPMHYNTFEDIKENPYKIQDRFNKSRYKTNTVILNPGESQNIR